MAVDRDLPTISSDPGGVSGSAWTTAASESVAAIWEHLGGVLTSVAQTDVNVVTASLKYGTGFSAYTEPLMTILIPVAANTGAVTLNIDSVGAVAIVRPDGTGLQAGDLTIGRPMFLSYIQALNKFVYLNFVDYSSITATLPQIKKRWLVDASLAASSGVTRTLCTFTDVQGAVGDILQFPAFHDGVDDVSSGTKNFRAQLFGLTTLDLDLDNPGGSANQTLSVSLYKDATKIGDIYTVTVTGFNDVGTGTWGDLGKGNSHMYELDDTGLHDYVIKLENSNSGGPRDIAASINGEVHLYTPDGTFS